ncbi:MAG: Thymidylate kinase [candidate division TM6 bacterium GW2011_GWF2_43_17]|nr:MAG: Thymidylate kinase [candidate division TM6 bacterium GW2011_GWF2_43_17]HAU30219.1 dTMP kinase [Candidatus Dependentiae bacterium]
MNRFSKGFLLVLEGLDGAGKTTTSNLLTTKLRQKGFKVLQTKEPGDSCIGSTLRTLVNTTKENLEPLAEYLLFAADRAQHVQEIVRPALERGEIVISDRMADSSLAYQGYGRGLCSERIALVNAWALGSIRPNLTVYLKLTTEEALMRITKRNEQRTRFEEQNAFLERVKSGFDTLFATASSTRLSVDGTKPPQEIVSIIYHHILENSGR